MCCRRPRRRNEQNFKLNTDCSTSNLSDVKIISKYGEQVFLHRIILAFAFPQFSELFPEGDSVTNK